MSSLSSRWFKEYFTQLIALGQAKSTWQSSGEATSSRWTPFNVTIQFSFQNLKELFHQKPLSLFHQTLALLQEEDDINQITDYFSYEHFYVVYCKFWELDVDHDLFIDPKDLARYNDHGKYKVNLFWLRMSVIC